MATVSRPVLILGATGGIGLHLVKQLLAKGTPVRALVRSPGKLPDAVKEDVNFSMVQASVTEVTDEELDSHVQECNAVVSCLGHVEVFGEPKDLVLQTARRVCESLGRVQSDESEVKSKFVLLNTVLVTNPNDPSDQARHGWASRLLVGALHWALPPMVDNTKTAHYLIDDIGPSHPKVEYCIVRPDSLSDKLQNVSGYAVHETLQNGVFSPIGTSKVNVANFMMRLVLEQGYWETWRGKMPVVVDDNASG